jgi:hypothetical protein
MMTIVTEEIKKSWLCLTYIQGVPRSNIGRSFGYPDRDILTVSLQMLKKYLELRHEPHLSTPYPPNFQSNLIIRR